MYTKAKAHGVYSTSFMSIYLCSFLNKLSSMKARFEADDISELFIQKQHKNTSP